MASVNRMLVLGNLGQDPELKYLPSGAAVCSISVATSRSWKNKESGEKMEETEWHRVTFFDRLAEIAGEYLSKGDPVFVEGRLKTRKWQDKDGNDRYTTDIVGDKMQMLSPKGETRRGSDVTSEPAGGGSSNYEEPPFQDDDIPF